MDAPERRPRGGLTVVRAKDAPTAFEPPASTGSPGDSPSRLRRLLLAGAAVLPAACAAPPRLPAPAVPPPRPSVAVGQRWRYETIDLYRRERIGELVATVSGASPLLVALAGADGAPIGEERWARPWDVELELAFDMPQRYERPMPLLPDRLEPGATRSDTTYFRVPGSDDRLYWQQRVKAIRWERIEVPAGGFDTLRIERFVNFRHVDIWREYPWRLDTLWYAPAVGRWVQREWTGEYRWPGGRSPAILREDWVAWRLLDWQRGA
ncbi:hypothetical protein M6I34_08880 [Burkholderiaceae bacterium FT117]|uniref:hypothetical protein n=1 Tax=Zeimonas sediminis TaxID=2944268 RepID=UPI00234308B9|nr:hypothetical protein [Zeimonas sediminis]MCM5570621.1 hypothetical protein [Zeimonas sediminis]